MLVAFLLFAQSNYYSLSRFIALEAPTYDPETDVDEDEPVAEAPSPMLAFSIDSVFVEPGDTLELTLPAHLADHTEVYYTLDGSDPLEGGTLYDRPIVFGETSGRGSWLVRARVIQSDTVSEIYERAYLPADGAVLNDGIYIVLLYGDDEDFYSEENGILARGAPDAETAMAEGTLPENRHNDDRANYYGKGAEWERPVMVEVYDSAGAQVMKQDAGVRVTGGMSRAHEQKSLRLYARKSYDADAGRFNVAEIFPQRVSADGSETPVVKYNHLDLRNGGNDHAATMLSDAAMRQLAYEAGFGTAGTATPAVVYLNGEYYGFAWLQPDYDEKNIAAMCALPDAEKVQVLQEAEHYAYNEDDPAAVDDYLYFYNLALGDLTKQRNADRLEELVDMDNLLLYYAIELYSNNQDWPHNNYKVWRYTGASAAEKAANPYADGRWRFLLYDLDYAFGTHTDGMEGFAWALEHGNSPVLKSILQNGGFRDRFVNIYCRLLGTTLGSENAAAVTGAMKALIEPEMTYRESLDPNELIYDAEYRQVMYWKLDDFIARRPSEIRQSIGEYFGFESQYTLDIQSPEAGATVWLDGYAYRAAEGLDTAFYNGAAVTLTYELAEGYAFAGWEVNGTLVEDETLVLGPFGEGENPGTQTVRLQVERQAAGQAVIKEICYKNDWNWIAFTNVGLEDVNLSGAYLTKNGEIIYVFPEEVLTSDEYLVVLEKSNDLGEDDKGQYVGDFKFRRDDEIRLYAQNGTLLDSVTLPPKNVGYIYHHNPYGAGWVWTSLDDYK